MGFQVKILTILGIFAICVTMSTCSLDTQFKSGLENFRNNIFHEIVKSNGHKNIIFSPFSTQTCLAMVRMGADGETAAEMDRAMGVSGQRTDTIADNYFTLLSRYDNDANVHLANKVYVMTHYELQDKYNEILRDKFHSTAEIVDFSKNNKAADVINNWVETKTNHLIKDIISPDMLSTDTRLVLLNVIHFKGDWLKTFNPERTTEEKFYLDETNTVIVQMMNILNRFDFGEFDNYSVVRLPYKDSDLSMLIFSPYEITGLADMLQQLRDTSLETITKKLRHQVAEISVPKFKVDFEIELTDTLKKLNMSHLFGNANFGKMLKSAEGMEISHVIHKACIEVTELGTEASAATAGISTSRMMPPSLTANRPFHYIILNTENVVLFQGNVVHF